MQLVTKGGLVLAYYPDETDVPMASFPGADLVPYSGAMNALGRDGPEPPSPDMDTRPFKAPARIDLRDYATSRRYAIETGGIVVNGSPVATDLGSQNRVANADAYLLRSGLPSIAYKSPEGFVTLSADQIKALALAIGGHVQACFAKEDEVDAAIAAGTITTPAEVDAAFAALTV